MFQTEISIKQAGGKYNGKNWGEVQKHVAMST